MSRVRQREAEALFPMATCLLPVPASDAADRGRALLERGQLEAAEAALQEAARLDPRRAAARHNLGVVLDRQAKYAAAAAAFREAIRLAPDAVARSEEHTSELQSPCNLVCRLLLEKKKTETSMSIVIYKGNSRNTWLYRTRGGRIA